MLVDLTRHQALVERQERSTRTLAATVRRVAERRVADQIKVRAVLADFLAHPAAEGDRAVLPPMPLTRPVL